MPVGDPGTSAGEHLSRRSDHRGHPVVDVEGTAEVDGERDPQPGERLGPPRRAEVPALGRQRPGHPRVRPGQHRQQQGQVAHVAGQRTTGRGALPGVVRRPLGYPPHRGPEPHHIAERRRVPQRPAHVGAIGEGDHAAGQRGGGTPARAARRAAQVVRVQRGAEDIVERVRPGAELRHVRPAYHHHARPAYPLHDQLVTGGHVVDEDRRAIRRAPARDLVGVLEREREPVQRPQWWGGGGAVVGRGPGRRRAPARSPSSPTIAFSAGLTAAMRARWSSSSSRAEIRPARSAASIDRAELKWSISVGVPARPRRTHPAGPDPPRRPPR